MKDFEYWNTCFREQKLLELSTDRLGLLWLKIKSITRKDILPKFASKYSIQLKTTKIGTQFQELYFELSSNVDKSHEKLDSFIQQAAINELVDLDVKAIESNLYKVKSFEWGGDYRNSLDKFLVSSYVKTDKIIPYDELVTAFDNSIKKSASGYVVNSWYNYWSSVLTEWIFKTHQRVLPTIGKIKNVDFFIGGIPFDLKVTYLPKEYIKIVTKRLKIQTELSYLKSVAKECNITFDRSASDEQCQYEITERLRNKSDSACKNVLSTVQKKRRDILNYSKLNKDELIQWLYENQGEMRFGSENRIFVLLVDPENFEESWKLKRNMDLLKPAINCYLDGFSVDRLESMKTNFTFKGTKYSTFSDLIFVVK